MSISLPDSRPLSLNPKSWAIPNGSRDKGQPRISFTESLPISWSSSSAESSAGTKTKLSLLPWTYTPRQQSVRDLINAAPDGSTVIIGYGGAVGGGKTFLEAGIATEAALDGHGYETLIGRQDFVDLKDTTLKQFDNMTRMFPYRRKYDTTPVYRELSRDGAVYGRVTFRGLDDWESLMSTEYGKVFIEEAHEVPLEAVLGLLSRLRDPRAKKWVMLIGFNPLGGWPEKWFMKGELPEEVANTPGLQVHFVPSRMSDNPHLRPGYEQMLRAFYPPNLAQKLIDGEPGGVENAIYPHFDRSIHVRDLDAGLHFSDGAFGGDFGRVHKSAAVAVSRDQYGRLWIREAWGRPSDDHGEALRRVVAGLRSRYGLRRGRVDPNQDVLAGLLAANIAKSGEGSRQHRVDLVGRLMNTFPGGIVPALTGETRGRQASYGPSATDDSAGLLFVKGAPGIDDLCDEIESYHYEHKLTDTKDEMVVARI